MSIAVYTDYAYSSKGGSIYADRAFALFLAALADRVDRMVIVGRLRPDGGEARYRLPDEVEFVPLPFYESLARPAKGATAMAGSLTRFWRTLDDVDACWLLGPHPLALAFAAIARIRGRRVLLGVRQDLVAYTASRHPGRRSFRLAARVLEGTYRVLGRFLPVIVVGPELRRQYRHSRDLLEIAVSLVPEAQLAAIDSRRDYSGELRILSVGRIDAEKNPLMLAEVLARLHAADGPRWKLIVCGEGDLEGALRERLADLGLAEHAELRGYVQHGERMRQAYADSHVLLHVSWTEGLPQVIIEATADRLPVVATDVGGIREAVHGSVLLVPPGDLDAAVSAVRLVASDDALRRSLIGSGTDYARAHTLEAEVGRLADFIEEHTGPKRATANAGPA